MKMMQPLFSFLLLLFSSPLLTSFAFRIELTRTESDGNLMVEERINRAMLRDSYRMATLYGSGSDININTSVHGDLIGAYLMDLSIGMPPMNYSAIVDTGSDLIWTKCQLSKPSNSSPVYDPFKSSTSRPVPCNGTPCKYFNSNNSGCSGLCSYIQRYGAGETNGTLGTETFTFGSTRVPNITFGCSTSTSVDFQNTSGLVGLARGSVSLVSQLNPGKFSYCLTSFFDTNSTSPLLLGSLATLTGAGVQSTPFVQNPKTSPYSSYYYLSLKGISVSSTRLPISPSAFALKSNNSGGLVIDSGTTITYLVDEAYQLIKQSIISLVNLPISINTILGLDLCYTLPSATATPPLLPNMTFHFDGADMSIPVNNYMINSETGLWCLMMSNQTLINNISILGNHHQQNMHILYDVTKEMLSFVPAQCNKI